MKGRRALALLVVALAVAAVLGILAIHERTPPVSPVEIVPTTWRTARETPMHTFHVGTKKIACTECHTSSGAEDAGPTAGTCTKCHEAESRRGHKGNATSATTCLSCHVFGGGKRVAQCADCHANGAPHGAPAIARHADQDVACGACHSIHGEHSAVLADCTSCHATISATHGRWSAHESHAEGAEPTTVLTMDAAVLAYLREAGAPSPFRAAHGGDATRSPEGGLFLTGALDPKAAPAGEVCSTCHSPHSGKESARATCAACHVGVHEGKDKSMASAFSAAAPKIAPRGARVAGHDACVTCHDPHRAQARDARACESCHGAQHAALDSKGHVSCKGCHAAHAPAEARGSCTTCHQTHMTLGASRVPAHADCTSCHDPHKPKASPEAACARCHESVNPSHPSAGGKGACVGCHAPHGGGKGPAQAAPRVVVSTSAPCSTCHTAAQDDRSFHAKGTACTQCHAPHGFRIAGTGMANALCGNCHAAKVTATATRPGHAACASCHGAAHAPVAKPTCQSCHGQEAATATKGHSTCTSCHDAHSGSLGTRATCTSCHENKKKVLHATLPSAPSASGGVMDYHAARPPEGRPGGESCATCHRAHGPKGTPQPAACSTCHARSSLVGLHAVSAHAPCETCHSAHGPPRSDRATCTSSCHADRRNHQPEAKLCKGCHLFRH